MRSHRVLLLLLMVVPLAIEARKPNPSRPSLRRVVAPVLFETNVGQAPGDVSFVVHQRGAVLQLTSQRVTAMLPRKGGAPLSAQFEVVGAANVRGEEVHRSSGRVNYLVGADRSAWLTNVPTSDRVIFKQVYPGIDLVWRTHDGTLEYDFVVGPGADPNRIRVAMRGEASLVAHAPRLFQRLPSGEERTVEGGWALALRDERTFWVGEYDRRLPLVIDPVLDFSTFLGGNNDDFLRDVTVDSSGAIYLVGQTLSTNFPTRGPVQAMRVGPSEDCFVTKIVGSTVEYSTYLGGLLRDEAHGVGVEPTGEAVIGGFTLSTDFPVVGAFQSTPGGGGDAFVARLSAQGSTLTHSTYLGGSGSDGVNALQLFGASVHLIGTTSSPNFPVVNAFQATLGGANDAFVARLSFTGTTSALLDASYLGGSDGEIARGIAVNATGTYLTGLTFSNDFPRSSALFNARGGMSDAFVTKVSTTGTVAFSTYLGGAAADQGHAIAVDAMGRAYVVGLTQSPDFPTTPNAPQSMHQGSSDAFAARFEPNGAALGYSTFLGGSGVDFAADVAVGPGGVLFIAGNAGSSNFPSISSVVPGVRGNGDAFLTKLNAAGTTFDFSTFLGGSAGDEGTATFLDTSGNLFIAGSTRSTDFPTVAPSQPTFAGTLDTFVARLSENDAGRVDAGPTDAGAVDAGAPDAGTVTPDAGTGTPDAGTVTPDAGTPDSGLAVDGGADAGLALDGGSTDAPRFVTTPQDTAQCGDEYSYRPEIVGTATRFELRATGAGEQIPEGLTVNASRGTLSWSIPERATGVYRFQLVAISGGREAAQQVVIDVSCRSLRSGCGCQTIDLGGLGVLLLVLVRRLAHRR